MAKYWAYIMAYVWRSRILKKIKIKKIKINPVIGMRIITNESFTTGQIRVILKTKPPHS